MRPATRAVRAGGAVEALKSLTPPLYQSSVFYAESLAEAVALEDPGARFSSYSRTANPTTVRFEEALAELEGAEAAVATPSGMAALTLTFLTFLTARDRIAVSPHSYADTLAVLAQLSEQIGFELLVTDLCDPGAPQELIRYAATFVMVESPSNPMLRTVDLRSMARCAADLGALLVVDSTLATPVNQRPLEAGCDLVMHSASKYLSGHFNVVGGVVAGSRPLIERMRALRTITGICPDPHSSWLLLQGLQTLTVRVRAQNAAARRVREFLARHPSVEFVAYPGPPGAPAQPDAAAREGFGGVLTFGLRGGPEGVRTFLESLQLCTIAVSLGGTRTVIEAPALMSHVQGGPDNPSLSVIPANAIRLSVGLEDVEDIIADLDQGLRALGGPAGDGAGSQPTVAGIVASVLGVPEVSGAARLRSELGVDSLTGTYILARLQREMGVRLPLPELLACGSVDDLSALVAARLVAAG